mgnify:CR=1 FL=1
MTQTLSPSALRLLTLLDAGGPVTVEDARGVGITGVVGVVAEPAKANVPVKAGFRLGKCFWQTRLKPKPAEQDGPKQTDRTGHRHNARKPVADLPRRGELERLMADGKWRTTTEIMQTLLFWKQTKDLTDDIARFRQSVNPRYSVQRRKASNPARWRWEHRIVRLVGVIE